jgi:hypothetical protein
MRVLSDRGERLARAIVRSPSVLKRIIDDAEDGDVDSVRAVCAVALVLLGYIVDGEDAPFGASVRGDADPSILAELT